MIDFEDLDRVSNVVCQINSTLSIKHVVEIKKRMFNNKKDVKLLPYGFLYGPNTKNPGTNSNLPSKYNNPSLLFNSTGYISIENKKTSVKNEVVVSETVRVKIVLMDTPQLLAILDTVTEWLTTQAEDVFMNDELGHPIKIINPMLKLNCPLMLETTGVTFKPCIVEDSVGTKYQGIAMGNREKGEICNFTATEFVVFKNMLAFALNNLYANNMLLIEHTMQYCMYKNFMEVINKNAHRNQN